MDLSKYAACERKAHLTVARGEVLRKGLKWNVSRGERGVEKEGTVVGVVRLDDLHVLPAVNVGNVRVPVRGLEKNVRGRTGESKHVRGMVISLSGDALTKLVCDILQVDHCRRNKICLLKILTSFGNDGPLSTAVFSSFGCFFVDSNSSRKHGGPCSHGKDTSRIAALLTTKGLS